MAKTITVLGSGCRKCVKTAEFIQTVASEMDVEVDVVKETALDVIMQYGVMTTPAVVIDEQVVHKGSIPSRSMVKEWLS